MLTLSKANWEPRARRCMFVGYPEGVKGYKLWYSEGNNSKSFIGRDVTFREAEMYMRDTGSSPLYENINTKNDARIEVEQHEDLNFQPPQGVSDLGNELEVHDREEFDDNVEEETFEIQKELEGYQLARDRVRRDRRAPQKYGYADLISFAMSVAEDMNENEPRNFQEAVKCKERHLWLAAMKDEMVSLNKN